MYRKITEWEWYSDPNVFRVFTHILFKANHEDKRWRGIDVKRGQLVTGRITLSEETGLTEREIRTALTKLKSTGELTIKTTNKFSIITVCNYCKYQSYDNDERPTERPTTEPTSDQETTTTKEVKNIRSKEKDSTGTKPKNCFDLTALPEGINRETILAFIEHRKTKGAKLTQHALSLICKSALDCQQKLGITPETALNYAIERGWQTCRVEWMAKADINTVSPQGKKGPCDKCGAATATCREASEAERATCTSWVNL